MTNNNAFAKMNKTLNIEMKIFCETQIVNRETQTTQFPRMVKSTLAVGYHQTAIDSNGQCKKELEIIHFTPKNKMGKRFKLRDNIEKIYTKFLVNGKATISFKQPPENLLIQCDPTQLKAFLKTLQLGLEGKDSINLKSNIAATMPILQKSQCQTKMIITNRNEYPSKGFPRSLKHLKITELKLCKITFDISSLKNLTVLNLSGNNLAELPNELGDLPIKILELSCNALGTNNCWRWLKGTTLKSHLCELDLSSNRINYFVPHLIQYENLVKLRFSHNKIERLPFGLRRMRCLRYLDLSYNSLKSLTAECASAHLELLDIGGCEFLDVITYDKASLMKLNNTKPPQLWQLCCKAISIYKLPFRNNAYILLPRTLQDILLESPYCACGHIICYPNSRYDRAFSANFDNIKSLIINRSLQVNVDIILCGPNCMGIKRLSTL